MPEEDLKERAEFRIKLNELWKCVLGNGHPEEGLKWKVDQNTINIQEMHDFMKVIKSVFWKVVTTAILGSLSALGLLIFQVTKMLIKGNVL